MRYGLPKFFDFLEPSACDQVACAHDLFPSACNSMRLCAIRLSSTRLRTITIACDTFARNNLSVRQRVNVVDN